MNDAYKEAVVELRFDGQGYRDGFLPIKRAADREGMPVAKWIMLVAITRALEDLGAPNPGAIILFGDDEPNVAPGCPSAQEEAAIRRAKKILKRKRWGGDK